MNAPGPRLRRERAVEHVDPAVVEVGRVEIGRHALADVGGRDGEALVDGVAGVVAVADLGGRPQGAAPAGDHPGLAGEQEQVAVEVGGVGARDRPGRGATGDRDAQSLLGAVGLVEGGQVRAVVRDPPRARREAADAPAVDEVRVGRRPGREHVHAVVVPVVGGDRDGRDQDQADRGHEREESANGHGAPPSCAATRRDLGAWTSHRCKGLRLTTRPGFAPLLAD